MVIQDALFKCVFDASSLINIERKRKMVLLRRRSREIIIPYKVAGEVDTKGTALSRFIKKYPHVIVNFSEEEERIYLQIRGQPGIHDPDAAVITVCIARGSRCVMDDRRAKEKAVNHGITVFGWEEFIEET